MGKAPEPSTARIPEDNRQRKTIQGTPDDNFHIRQPVAKDQVPVIVLMQEKNKQQFVQSNKIQSHI
jgi:hypothetical protein